MSLFFRKKDQAVQSFVLKMLNNKCPGLTAAIEGPRNDSRVNLAEVVVVVPLDHQQLALGRSFTAVTKEFSNTGVAVVTDKPCAFTAAILGFRFEGEMHYVRADMKHCSPLGGGFSQLGFQMVEVVALHDYPELETMSF